jgi:hypothetical protein
MYRCMITKRNSREGDKLHKIVALTRPQTYKHWDPEEEENWTTEGSEIVLELNACQDGVRIWESWTPTERAEFIKNLHN